MEKLKYTVKVINAVIKKLDINGRFSDVSDLKDQLESDLATLLEDGADFLFEYIQRGNGMMNNFPHRKELHSKRVWWVSKKKGDNHVDEDLSAFLLKSKSQKLSLGNGKVLYSILKEAQHCDWVNSVVLAQSIRVIYHKWTK